MKQREPKSGREARQITHLTLNNTKVANDHLQGPPAPKMTDQQAAALGVAHLTSSARAAEATSKHRHAPFRRGLAGQAGACRCKGRRRRGSVSFHRWGGITGHSGRLGIHLRGLACARAGAPSVGWYRRPLSVACCQQGLALRALQ